MIANRLHNLDYLRGIAAFGVMIYHYLSWTFGSFTADTFMGRIGVYGVAIFYILSGLTLFHVYHDKMEPTWSQIIQFFKKRVFRIFPLLWLVTIIAILISNKTPNFFHLVLNLTGLFGFFMWDVSFSTGVWSIGNELVFYAFFPLFIFYSKKSLPIFWLIGVIIFLIFVYFAFIKLHSGLPPADQARDYFNPLNNLFLFFGGFAIGKLFYNFKMPLYILMFTFLSGMGLLIFYPAFGIRIDLLTGMNRMIFTCSSFLICMFFYKLNYKFPEIIHKPFTLLGESSYSVYLLHPIVFTLSNLCLKEVIHNSAHLMYLAIILTFILSYFSYNYFEKLFMKLGRTEIRNDSIL